MRIPSSTRAFEAFLGRQVSASVTRAPQRLRVRGRDGASTSYEHRGHHTDGRLTVGLVTDEHVFGVQRTTVGHTACTALNLFSNALISSTATAASRTDR
ncbi:unnamed protein product [Macrosiphum euphorbiae]|uniref:Uncharacterized protein n=1 Tax=Macrosiphum euphorbiae TaxID=13131 RepID=A0AAV0WL09_9HEMI|nr:unnamed protein product [Macrosiphum euphorbiae]